MKISWVGVFAIIVLAFACNQNDEVVPRTNPRFSMTFVQEINASGAEFMANIYDFGSDKIEEYGFIYSFNDRPSLETGEVLKAAGKPTNPFKLVGNHSMEKGKSYYVVAFIKTDKSTVYSEPIQFTSQGSEGFIFEKLNGGPEVYYGDTLTVFGNNLSSNLDNYEVKVNETNARVILNDDRSFKVVIPEKLGFGYTYDYDGKLVISIKVVDKTLKINTDIQFYDPIIYPSDKEFKYEEDFYIKGKYLRDPQILINLLGSSSYYTLPIVSMSDTLVVFKPFLDFETLQPEFQLYLRGKSYEVKESIRIQKTEIIPGQKLKSGSIYSHLIIQGSNFNSVNMNSNFFISDVEGQQFYVQGANPEEIKVYVQSENLVPNPRLFKVWTMNGGVQSENFVSVENTEPVLAYMHAHTFPFNAAAVGRSVNWRDKGIWLLDGKITEVDPKDKSGRILKNVDLKQGNIASSFAVIHQDVVYFAGSENTISNTPGRFYSYDLISGSLIELPTIPTKASTPRSAFVSGGYLYFGGGYYRDEIDIQKVAEGYKFNLTTRTWSTWNKKFSISDNWDFETTFEYRGQIYGFVNETRNSEYLATRLMVFDSSQEDWVELAKYPYLGYSNGNVAMPIGDTVYVLLGNTLHKINMSTYGQSAVRGINIYNQLYAGPPFLFLSEENIYYSDYNSYILNEMDPSYFRE